MSGSRLDVGGIHLHVVQEGTGPLVLLLHGFPEFWYAWRHQIGPLAAAGFTVAAPDLRGYNLSDRPAGVPAYGLELLVGDVAGLIENLGAGGAVLVGHDWGGIIAWYTAMHRPDLVRRLVVLNAPHPVAYARELRRPSSQIVRSWYAAAHQIPAVPEMVWGFRDLALLRRLLRGGAARSPEEIESYLEVFRRSGAMTSALNYYRAALREGRPPARPIAAPTLLIWGERDPYLVPSLTNGLDRWVPNLTVHRLPDAGHWLHHTHAATVTSLIAAFARGGAGESTGARP